MGYALRLIRGVDQGICPTDCLDEFEIVKDGSPLMGVIFDYGLNGADCTITVKHLSADQETPPNVGDGPMVAAAVSRFLVHKTETSGYPDFYADLFVDEQGDPVDLPMSDDDFDILRKM